MLDSWEQVTRCPQCLEVLHLKTATTEPKPWDEALACSTCHTEFPIIRNVPFFGIRKDNVAVTLVEIEAENKWFAEESTIEEHISFANSSARVGWNMITELGRYLPSEPTLLRVLDLGSGAGMQAWQLANYGRFSVAAVDCVGEFLIEAPESVCSHPNVKRFCSNLETVPFGDHTFDVIFCKESLHHIPDLRVAFGEIVRVAKPGALLVIKEPLWPCRTVKERAAFKLTDRAAKVGITHAYYCFNDYMLLLDTTAEILRLRFSPSRNKVGRQLLWFATDSRRLPRITKQVFKLLTTIYERIWKTTANWKRMNEWGGEFFVIAKIKNDVPLYAFHFDRTIVPINIYSLMADDTRRATIKSYNEKIFREFDRVTKALKEVKLPILH